MFGRTNLPVDAKNVVVGITGHRTFPSAEVSDFVKEQIEFILTKLRQEHKEITALSAIAKGADTLFALTALKLGFRLEVVIPFSHYEEDFHTPEALELYRFLINQASRTHHLEFKERSDDAYLSGGKWIVDQCNLLIAVWDGQPASGKGGTGDVIKYAQNVKKSYWHVDSASLSVKEVRFH